MDKVRKGLLITLALIVAGALIWMGLTFHRDAIKRLESQLEQYNQQMEKLSEITGNYNELNELRTQWEDELASLQQELPTETYSTLYTFSQAVLKTASDHQLEIEKYRFVEENGQSALLEISFNGHERNLFRFLETVSTGKSSWYITTLNIHRGRNGVSGMMRIGYE